MSSGKCRRLRSSLLRINGARLEFIAALVNLCELNQKNILSRTYELTAIPLAQEGYADLALATIRQTSFPSVSTVKPRSKTPLILLQ